MEWSLCESCVIERIWSLQSVRGECDITKSCPLWAFSTCWETLLTKCNIFLRKINQLGQFSFSYFFKCSWQSASLLPTLPTLSNKCDDDWWWDLSPNSLTVTRGSLELGLPDRFPSALSPLDHPRAAPGLSELNWALRLHGKTGASSYIWSSLFQIHPKVPQHPHPGNCWGADTCRTQLCEEAPGCKCSAPNQHVGVCHPTHFVKLQWPCPHHSDTWHTSSTASRTDWVLSVFFVFSPEALLRWAGIAITFCPFLPISGLSFVHPKISPLWHLHI